MTKGESYNWAKKRVRAQVLRHVDVIATLANTAAILKEYFNFFWVGFYFVHKDFLLLGPFQGPPACVKLALELAHAIHRDLDPGGIGKDQLEKDDGIHRRRGRR